ncbi:MAG: two-component regulator propeller domain-containing protein [Acidobacteriota bacterium]|nr:two-component regulator propeller domain-containing protein [Acidobacteriota bacterium]
MRKAGLLKAAAFLAGLGLSLAYARPAAATDMFRNRFLRLTIEDGLSQGSALTVLQDRLGFLWIGTEDGLNRYDGKSFRIYRQTPAANSLCDKWIRVLFLDSRGTLWIGTPNGLNRYNEKTDDFARILYGPDDPQNPGGRDVTSIAEDAQGRLWIGTNGGGLNAFDPRTGKRLVYRHDPNDPASLNHDVINAIMAGRDGKLWLGTAAGLGRLDPATGRFTRFVHDARAARSLSHDRVLAVFEDNRERLWIGTEGGGLNVLDRASGRFTRYRHDAADPSSLSHDIVNTIFQDGRGRLLVGTLQGLSVFNEDTGRFQVLRNDAADPGSLSYDYIISLFEDRTGILWIGTRGRGLNKFVPDRERFSLIESRPDAPDSLVSNYIRAIAEDGQGRLWIGTEDKGLDRLDRRTGKVVHFAHDPRRPGGLSGNNVYAVRIAPDGTVWIGILGGGIDRYDPKRKRFTHFRHSERDPGSLSSDEIRSLCLDSKGRLWVGTNGGGLNRLDPGRKSFIRYAHDPNDPKSLSHNLVRTVFEDRSGTIWVGTFGGGLNRWDPGQDRFVRLRKEADGSGLCNDFVMALDQDAKGNLWIGTNDGVNKLDPATGKTTCITDRDGLPNSSAYGLLVDAKQMVWIASNRGLARLDPESGAIKAYDVADGLQGNEFNGGASFRAASGEMFFGGTNGLNAFFPGRITDNPYPPAVVLTGFQIFNKPVPVGGEINGRVVLEQAISGIKSIRLSYRARMISFEFAALHFAAPEKNRFAYRMEGLETDWNEVGGRNYAGYSNLKPGRYVFRVKAANNDGIWNEAGVSLAVRIVPAVWMTWWFRALFVLGLGLAAAGFVWRRVGAVRQRAADLEIKIQARTAELREQIVVREKAEAELDKRQKFLEATLFGSSNAIVATDAQSNIIEWSRGAERIFGWRRNEVLGRNIDDVVIRPEFKDEAVRLQSASLGGKALNSIEAIRHRKDGTPINVIVGGSPVILGGTIAGSVAVYTDITELKRAEAAAREASRAKSEFLANMSHEIRTPMNGIFGMTELALETELNPEQREYLEGVKTSAEALMTIINDILDFSKIEARKIDLEAIPFRLRDTIHAIVSGVAVLAEKKGLEIAYDIPADAPDGLRGDPGRLRQVLTNLLANAIKFTTHGEVVVTVSVEQPAADRARFHFQVRDTGIGIAPDKLNLVFEPFTQADTSTTRLYGGTGLGLAICSQLVELMNGRLWAESEEGKGSVFHFTVDLELDESAAGERDRIAYDDLRGLPVLVVDDNATNRRILLEILANWGMKPVAAEGAAQALERLRASATEGRPFRLILTDANMPDLDGFDLAGRVKEDPDFGNAVIMMLSSSGFRGDSARCRQLGLAAYLTKPVKQSQLLDAIMLALGTPSDKSAGASLITRHTLIPSHVRYSILLAEDNIINQKLAVRILENRGHKVTVAGNGREALEVLEKGSFDVVLMDVQMPEMDGFQATAAIRAKEKDGKGHLPIVAMTAHAMAGDREKCLMAGMDDYVAKPLKPVDLFQTLERVVESRGREA